MCYLRHSLVDRWVGHVGWSCRISGGFEAAFGSVNKLAEAGLLRASGIGVEPAGVGVDKIGGKRQFFVRERLAEAANGRQCFANADGDVDVGRSAVLR